MWGGRLVRRAAGDPSLREILRCAQDFGAQLKRRAIAPSFAQDDASDNFPSAIGRWLALRVP
jgi:hypothetical protein